MTPEELAQRVGEIIAASDDPEKSHHMEDELSEELARAWAPAWVHSQLDRLAAADLTRWYA